MKRRYTPLTEKQQDYAAVDEGDEYNDTDSLLKEKNYKYQQQPLQPAIVYSSNKVKRQSERDFTKWRDEERLAT